ncbi:MAG TPA: hypothetical protein VGY48_15270 [Vicinamibacterales bacterium]|jgi:hypothetical protein|nr:hypothetical protein [Vicinamibacterales bacterium]
MTVKEMKKRLVGRRIVAIEARAFRDGDIPASKIKYDGLWEATRPTGGAITYDPVFILDDGTRLSFRVHETEIGEYGIDPVIVRR